MAGGRVSEASSAVPLAPHSSHYRLNHPPPAPIRGKIVFHETGPWCKKGWGPLVYVTLGKFFFLYFLIGKMGIGQDVRHRVVGSE